MPGWKRDVGRRLDALIVRLVPNVTEAVRWNFPFYGTEERGFFLNLHCLKGYIKVAFFNGTSLDPMPPIESRNKGTRYFHIYEDDALDEKQLASWIRQVSMLPGGPASLGERHLPRSRVRDAGTRCFSPRYPAQGSAGRPDR
jgi:hypothetical protein